MDERIREHFRKRMDEEREARLDDLDCWIKEYKVNSPVEQQFFAEWFIRHNIFREWGMYEIILNTQKQIKCRESSYRVDFLLTNATLTKELLSFSDANEAQNLFKKYAYLVVEIDGHQFHEKTKEQVAYRNRRDLDLAREGYNVLHFSGSQIYRDARKCVGEAMDFLMKKEMDYSQGK